jgi:hypothetical protein
MTDERITALPVAAATSTPIAEWYVIHAGEELGPLSLAELVGKAAIGEIAADDLVKKTGDLWAKASNFDVLQQQFLLKVQTAEPSPAAALPFKASVVILVTALCAILAIAALMDMRWVAKFSW